MKGDSREQTEADRLFAELRSRMPTRALQLFEHLLIAERQASDLLAVHDQTGPAVSLRWLTELDGLTVVLRPRWKMEGLSGLTSWSDDRWVIGINQGNPHARRRFTLAHEFKHALDGNRDKITYKGIDDRQREQIADYFAACYLMPKAWLRRAWTGGIQDPEALAGLFNVSVQAMMRRLRYLGYIDAEPERETFTYFRISSYRSDLVA